MILMQQMMACCGAEPVASGGTAWWLADGAIAESEVLAAFDPKTAGTLAESMVNIVNPGVYDLEDIDGDLPTLDSGVGWLFTAEQWMRLPKQLDSDVSLVVRWQDGPTDQSGAYVCGVNYRYSSDRYFYVDPGYNHFSYGWEKTQIGLYLDRNTHASTHTPAGTAVLVNSFTDGYTRGFMEGASYNESNHTASSYDIYVGGADSHFAQTIKSDGFSGHITHFAAYNTALTDAQAEAIRAHVDSL